MIFKPTLPKLLKFEESIEVFDFYCFANEHLSCCGITILMVNQFFMINLE